MSLDSFTLDSGAHGVYQTLKIMADITRLYKKNEIVRRTAAAIVQHVPAKNYRREVDAIYYWVQQNIRYLRDIYDVETLHDPVTIMQEGYGDCDDMSILLASMLMSIGHPVRFVAVGNGPDLNESFDHVYIETLVGSTWIPLDASEPLQPGQAPAVFNQYMRVYA